MGWYFENTLKLLDLLEAKAPEVYYISPHPVCWRDSFLTETFLYSHEMKLEMSRGISFLSNLMAIRKALTFQFNDWQP